MLSASRVDGRIRLSEQHRLMDVPVADVDGGLSEPPNQVCEFRFVPARRALLDAMGGLDERLIAWEQIDFALRSLALGARATFAEKAWVTYLARDALDPVDLRYHLIRWADAFVAESLDALEGAWGVTVDRELYRHEWAAAHRARAAATAYPRRRRRFGERRFARWVAGLERRILEEQLVRRGDRTPSVSRPVPARGVDRVVGGLLVHSG